MIPQRGAPIAKETSRPMRLVIATDGFGQCAMPFGKIGITISSRAFSAAAHGHKWGIWLCWILDRTPWLGFGRDANGCPHGKQAILHDIARCDDALWELTEPETQAYMDKFPDMVPDA
jgi:hypothetical protein